MQEKESVQELLTFTYPDHFLSKKKFTTFTSSSRSDPKNYFNKVKLYIQNMVCIRCQMVVKD